MKKIFKNIWATLFFLLITLNCFSIKNDKIETKIRIFENGLANKDVDMTMIAFDKDALWENTHTYYLFKEDLIELFNYYKTIKLQRINLKIINDNGYIISKANYQFETEVNNSGEFLKQNITFIFLWEKKNNDWKIIATNLPRFKKSASEVKGIVNSSGGNINNTKITHATFQNALAKPCGTDKAFIRSLYQSILDRDMEDVSFKIGHGGDHLQNLQNGDSRWKVIYAIFNSPEYKNKHKNHTAFMRDAYQAVLAREPRANEINVWPQIDRNTILIKFFNLEEYRNIKKDCSNHKQIINTASLTGKWTINQNNGYTGIMNLQKKSNSYYTGNVIWNGYLKGTIQGQLTGSAVSITIDYHNGDIGYYNGTLMSDGNKIINGTIKGNNGVNANWTAIKVIYHSINKTKENVWALNNSDFIYNWNGGNWDHLLGKAQDIGVGANGSVWIAGTESHTYGGNVYKLVESNFVKMPGQAVRLDVDPEGNPWGINSLGHIYKWQNNTWQRMSGGATDIGIGANGTVWIIGQDANNGNYGIYRWTGSQWAKVPGAAVRIDVGPNGNPWVVNSFGDIYKLVNNTWEKLPGKAKDISVGSEGTAWIIGTNSVLGGYGIYKWNGSKWVHIPGGATAISVGGKK